jgi:hypothetical protein
VPWGSHVSHSQSPSGTRVIGGDRQYMWNSFTQPGPSHRMIRSSSWTPEQIEQLVATCTASTSAGFCNFGCFFCTGGEGTCSCLVFLPLDRGCSLLPLVRLLRVLMAYCHCHTAPASAPSVLQTPSRSRRLS